TLHDMDGVMERSLEGVLGYSGEELYHAWVYDVHRALIHTKYLDRHDDAMFHCKLLFDHLEMPFDEEEAQLICTKFDDAHRRARKDPIYFPDAVPALESLKAMGLQLCLSTGFGAGEKAKTFELRTGKKFFAHTFSEPSMGLLKTEPEYYRKALRIAKAKPSETVSIGDTPLSDIRPAKMVGIKTIWVNRNQEPKPTEVDQIADYETRGLSKAVDIIRRLNL
ncbi:HAD family hydrolase, partial [Candidatus Bathyarchaeota archaeon]|nr:HAD family hydrolase [Candidatus Bathyarchaeota archaeon]